MGSFAFCFPGPADFDAAHLLDVMVSQRRTFLDQLSTLSADEWAAPTRCEDWTVHEVVRHLCDTHELAAGVGADSKPFEGFDPRITPRSWLEASAGEPPERTLERLASLSDAYADVARARLQRGEVFDIPGPYGAVDWTVLMMHLCWDAWIHERDILLPLGREHPTSDDAARYVTAYVIFVSGVVARMFRSEVEATFRLSGVGGGTFDLRVGEAVTLDAANAPDPGGPAAPMVADALTGRGAPVGDVIDLDPTAASALSALATFFNTPV